MKPAQQNMQLYTAADYEVWQKLFTRQVQTLQTAACSEYLEALSTIGFNAKEIPDVRKINAYLLARTGWQVIVVPNIVAEKEFFIMLSEKKFPVTVWLRTPAQLDYIEEPDMFHDVFGHVPLLANVQYTSFFKMIGDIALKNLENTYIIERLGRLYWFTIEFGLMRTNNRLCVYGAGIISSPGEIAHALGNSVKVRPYDAIEIMETRFNNTVIQNLYFQINSFEELFESVPFIKTHLETGKQVLNY